jgi:hypothetical protein
VPWLQSRLAYAAVPRLPSVALGCVASQLQVRIFVSASPMRGLTTCILDVQNYCRDCAHLRQRGYKRQLTLRDLRTAMHLQGGGPSGHDFLDTAARISKSAKTAQAVSADGGASSDDGAADVEQTLNVTQAGGGLGALSSAPGVHRAGNARACGAVVTGSPTPSKLHMTEATVAELLATGVSSSAAQVGARDTCFRAKAMHMQHFATSGAFI